MFNGNGLSLADIAAVSGNRNNDNGFGDGGWWAWIILFALFGGWGGNWGGFGGGNGGNAATQADIQRGFDNQSVINKLNGLENGLCSLGYDQLAQMNGINTNILQTGFGLQQAINNASVAQMQANNAIQTQMSNCCCGLEKGQMQAEYNRATDTCTITTAIANAVNAIQQNCDCNYRALDGRLTQMEMNAKDETIASLRAALSDCNRDNALSNTANYIINTVRPTPNPAWIVPNPMAGTYGFGFNNGNGCPNAFNTNCC